MHTGDVIVLDYVSYSPRLRWQVGVRATDSGIASDIEEHSIGSAHVHRFSGTAKQGGVSTADRIH